MKNEYKFPERIRELRIERGLTHQQMADIVGKSKRGYINYESNESVPHLMVFLEIANYFEVSLDYLIGYSDVRKINKA